MNDSYAQEAEGCAKQAEPSPTTVENLLDQHLNRLMSEIHRVIQLKLTLPFSVRRSSASEIRELAQLL